MACLLICVISLISGLYLSIIALTKLISYNCLSFELIN